MPRNSLLITVAALLAAAAVRAESGYDAWLRYRPIDDPAARHFYDHLPAIVVVTSDTEVLSAAREELIRGVRGMLGRTLRTASSVPDEPVIVIGTIARLRQMAPAAELPAGLPEEGFHIQAARLRGHRALVVVSADDRGALYGTFALLRRIALRRPLQNADETEQPFEPVRWTNEWDNLDGSIERGYAGRSIFFENGRVLDNLDRVRDYARLLASIGINGCTINNVNANPLILSSAFLPQLARVAAAFRPWGIRMSIAAPFSSPKTAGGLDTFDPLDPRVAGWWKQKVDEIYRAIPDLAGFVVKADSEGQAGPSTYGRTHADAANVIARALKPHGGILIYRAFVYDHHMDWRNLKNDRARAAWDNFHPLDGRFDDNVALQIKYGPIDFQVREPVSPLFGAMKHTSELMELQVTQEYTGQQHHLCYLAPMWKEILDSDMHAAGDGTPVKDIVAGRTFHRPLGGMVAVTNAGQDRNWLGHDLAMANLYAFGRLAWNPAGDVRKITADWTRLTFGHNARVVDMIVKLQLASWPAYEKYTGPLGVGTLTDIVHGHYGPNPESSERNGWGQWHRAGEHGIGMDRTVATGTGYLGQYSPAAAQLFESLARCPDDLLLFMHHVPWTHVLHSGRTVIQQFYDAHYEGAATAQDFPREWATLSGLIDDDRFRAVLDRLEYQAGHAILWRDDICAWAARVSGIPDAKGRVGRYPGRVEAEAMQLEGYTVIDIQPSEGASGGKAVACAGDGPCSASFRFNGEPGWYDIGVRYFDQDNGTSAWQLSVAGQLVDSWRADDHLPATAPNADSSTRRTIREVALRPGDSIRIEGAPDEGERAPLDYVEVRPAGVAPSGAARPVVVGLR